MIRLTGLVNLKPIHSLKEDVMDDGEPHGKIDDHEGEMAKAQLLSIHKNSGELYNMLGDNEELEGWIQAKLTKAAEYIDAVYHNLSYEKTKPATIGNGEGAPADAELDMMKEEMCEGEGCEEELKELSPNTTLHELSPELLNRYIDKTGARKGDRGGDIDKLKQQAMDQYKQGDIDAAIKTGVKIDKRYKGASSAFRSLEKQTDQRNTANREANRAAIKALQNDQGLTVKNPETGEEILATTAYKAGPAHPAYQAAKATLKKEIVREMSKGVNEVSPEGWEGTVKAMKDHPEIDNPWALAYYMKKKGYKSHKKEK